jgi:hypothetical protein
MLQIPEEVHMGRLAAVVVAVGLVLAGFASSAQASPCPVRSGVTLVPAGGVTVPVDTPQQPVAATAPTTTLKRFVLDLGAVADAALAPVDVTVSWGSAVSDFDIAVTDRFGFQDYGAGASRNALTQQPSEAVALPNLAHCAEFAVKVTNVAGAPTEVLSAHVAVGRPLSAEPPAPEPLSRKAWVVSGSPGAEATTPQDLATNAIDGKLDTRWSTGANQLPFNFFQVDLGAPTTISRLVMDAGTSPDDFPRTFDIQVSDDGNNWTQIAGGAGSKQVTDVRFPAVKTRYVKIDQSSAYWPNYWSIAELNLYATR